VFAVFGLLLAPAALLAAAGNPTAGKALFEGKGGCLNCHSLDGRGGSLGPELDKIGLMRATETLRLALVDPSAEVYKEFLTTVIVTKRGQTIQGIALNEDDLSIQIRDTAGNPRSYLKDDLKSVRRENRSLMPSFASKLSATEIDDLVAYLHRLRGPALPVGPRTRQPHHAYSDVSFLDRIGRDAEERPDTLVNSLQIPAGASVAEIGSGTGYFTWRLARNVGASGKVYAVDIAQDRLDRTEATVKKHQYTNVQYVLGGESDPHLPEASLDIVFIANAYHEFSNPEAMLAAIKRSLKPDGRLVIMEYAEGFPFGEFDRTPRMTIDQIRSEIEPAGFEIDRLLEIARLHHTLVFTKTGN
jgi:putative heme-binding domain-containing protein